MYTASTTTPLWPSVAALLAVSFAVNRVWEVVQMALYVPAPGRSRKQEFLICTLASAGDAVLTLLVFAAGALVMRSRQWVRDGAWKAYALAALAGAALAAVIEWAALGAGYWSYASGMPRVPLLGVGLLPFVQRRCSCPFRCGSPGV